MPNMPDTIVVPFVPGVKEGDKNVAKKVSDMITAGIIEWEGKGYEFDNMHTVYITSQPGCLGVLSGNKAVQFPLTYVTFKKKPIPAPPMPPK